MLATVYHILSICLGEPVQQFTWTPRDASGKALAEPQLYTPQEFYKKYVGTDLKNSYVMLMNDPSRPYHKTYTIDMDRHSYDGMQWTYLNLPVDEIKAMAIASIKDSVMMYFSCDVGKYLDSKRVCSRSKLRLRVAIRHHLPHDQGRAHQHICLCLEPRHDTYGC